MYVCTVCNLHASLAPWLQCALYTSWPAVYVHMYVCTVCYSYILYMYSRNCTYVMLLINPRWRVALRGVTVIGLSLCVCVCVSESNLVLQAIRGDL